MGRMSNAGEGEGSRVLGKALKQEGEQEWQAPPTGAGGEREGPSVAKARGGEALSSRAEDLKQFS